MKTHALLTLLLATATPAICAPPPELRSALDAWATPKFIARYQFSLVDLNEDGRLDAVVHITDRDFCGNGGCPLVTFRRTSSGFALVGSSGLVRKPIYILNHVQGGWRTLAAVVGLGNGAGMVPIEFKAQQGSYRSTPYVNAHVELTSPTTKKALVFEEVP